MRGVALSCCVLSLIGWHVMAGRDGLGSAGVYCAWIGEDVLELHIEFDAPAEGTHPASWVLTLAADRFDDGIFAWQIHLGEEFESILVIPNDFLTARNFTFAQLGIELMGHVPGASLWLRIPRNGAIAQLVAPGDRIDVHALWMQQAPIASLTVPSVTEVVAREAGGGAAADESESSGELSISPLPAASEYVRGDAIRCRFVLPDIETGEPMLRVGASYTLARAHEGMPYEIVRVASVPQDPVTGILEYEIDTSPFEEGTYELIIATLVGDDTYRLKLTILSSSE